MVRKEVLGGRQAENKERRWREKGDTVERICELILKEEREREGKKKNRRKEDRME